jgi:hypothetical protein
MDALRHGLGEGVARSSHLGSFRFRRGNYVIGQCSKQLRDVVVAMWREYPRELAQMVTELEKLPRCCVKHRHYRHRRQVPSDQAQFYSDHRRIGEVSDYEACHPCQQLYRLHDISTFRRREIEEYGYIIERTLAQCLPQRIEYRLSVFTESA